MSAIWWKDKPWRMIQTNLREIDMADLDAKRYVDDMVSFGASVCMPSVAGIVANYPTRLPYHFTNEYLTGDSMRQLVDMCHARGIHVIGRMDFSKVRRSIFEQHPEWAYIGCDGETIDFNGNIHVCFNSEYQQILSMNIIRECVAELDLDGLFLNMSGYAVRYEYTGIDHGPCQCENCRKIFAEMFQTSLPTGRDADKHPLYQEFTRITTERYEERFSAMLDQFKPGFLVANAPKRNGMFIRVEAGTYLAKPTPEWCYESGMFNKYTALVKDIPTSVTTDDFIDMNCRFSAVSPYQQTLRLAQSLAEGNCLDYYLMGRLDNREDRSGFAGISRIFRYHQENEPVYRTTKSKADILLVQIVHPYRVFHTELREFQGWFRLLTESHRLFDVGAVELLNEDNLKRYRLVIVPGESGPSALKPETVVILNEYVRNGGQLLVTGQLPAEAPQNWPCLGLNKVVSIRKDLRSAYFRFRQEERYSTLPSTDLVYVNGTYVQGEYAPEANRRLQMIPPCPYGPPENCYYTEITDDPALVSFKHGKGVGVYIPWYPGNQFFRNGYLVLFHWMDGVLADELNFRGIDGNLPNSVQITLRACADGDLLLHLINASGFLGGVYYEPTTMHGIKVSVPCLAKPHVVRSLVHANDVPFEWADEKLTIYPSPLGLFDAVQITF